MSSAELIWMPFGAPGTTTQAILVGELYLRFPPSVSRKPTALKGTALLLRTTLGVKMEEESQGGDANWVILKIFYLLHLYPVFSIKDSTKD